MAEGRVTTCDRCHVGQIIWAWTRRDGKSAKRTPIDAESDPHGRIALVWDQAVRRLVARELTRPTQRDGFVQEGWELHQPHRNTCPKRESWSRGPWK